MNITVEPTAGTGTDGNTLASGDEAFQRAVDAGIDAVDKALDRLCRRDKFRGHNTGIDKIGGL